MSSIPLTFLKFLNNGFDGLSPAPSAFRGVAFSQGLGLPNTRGTFPRKSCREQYSFRFVWLTCFLFTFPCLSHEKVMTFITDKLGIICALHSPASI